jgi:tRNA dimethylallyltransferase
VVVVGPTAVGKTALSIHLAVAFGGEIISADSRQVYRGMDIGTAKATSEQRARVPHHLIDVVAPDETFTLAQYQKLAYTAIDETHERGRIPIIVGGSGQYVRAVVEGWGIPAVAPRHQLRAALGELRTEELARWLSALDPGAAERIDYRNRRRVVRALEVTLVTGKPISAQQKKAPPSYRIVQFGLTLPRLELYRRIDDRVDRMIESGLLEETRSLMEEYGWHVPALSGLGYAQLGAYLQGQMTWDQAVAAVKRETRRFVRHQSNWFKRDDPAIHWFVATQAEQTANRVERFLQEWLAKDHAAE